MLVKEDAVVPYYTNPQKLQTFQETPTVTSDPPPTMLGDKAAATCLSILFVVNLSHDEFILKRHHKRKATQAKDYDLPIDQRLSGPVRMDLCKHIPFRVW